MSAQDDADKSGGGGDDVEVAVYSEANLTAARELLEVIERVKTKQEEWQTVLALAMAQDQAEEAVCNRMFRRVQASQMRNLESEAFEQWLDAKTVKGGASNGTKDLVRLGTSKLEKWFHDDLLIAASPFAAVVPVPRSLTDAGRKEVAATIESLKTGEFFVENFPFHGVGILEAAKALGVISGGPQARQEPPLQYLTTPCTTGEDALHLLDSHQPLQAAIESTPCLFLNDRGGPPGTSTVERIRHAALAEPDAPARGAMAVIRCIVIGGCFVAAEGAASTFSRKSDRTFVNPAFAANLSAFVDQLTAPPASTLHERSVQLVVLAVAPPTSSGSSSPPAALPAALYLVDVAPFSGSDTDFFKLGEVLLLAEYRSTLRNDTGVEGDVLIRMAGSPWKPISAVIRKPQVARAGGDEGEEEDQEECAAAPRKGEAHADPEQAPLPLHTQSGISTRAAVLLSIGSAAAAAVVGVTLARRT